MRDDNDPTSEQDRLDAAMRRADELLVDSLRRDEGRRQHRRRTILLISGGLAVTAAIVFLTLFVWVNPETSSQTATTKPAAADAQQAQTLSAEGWRLWQRQQPAEAEAKFVQSVALDPTAPAAWNGLGWSRVHQGKNAEAIEPFEKAIAIEPDHAGASNGLGQAYMAEGKLDLAEPHLLRAAANEANPAFWALAKLYLLRGDFDRALPWTLLLVRESPGNADAREMLHAARTRKLDEKLRKQLDPTIKA